MATARTDAFVLGYLLDTARKSDVRFRQDDHILTCASTSAGKVRHLRDEEKLGPAAIARRLGIGRASVYRVLGKATAPALT